MGWQDTERGHTGMAGVGTEVGGSRCGGGGVYGSVRLAGGFNKQQHSREREKEGGQKGEQGRAGSGRD